jgi:hypothetical protein
MEDVNRVFHRLGLTIAIHQQSAVQPPTERKAFVGWCWEVAAGCFSASLVLVCISWLLNTRHSQVLAVLGCVGFGVLALLLSLTDISDDVPFGGVDFRGFLFSLVFVLGGFGGAVLGLDHDTAQGRIWQVALGLAGVPSFVIYARKIWLYFREPVGGRHEAPLPRRRSRWVS